MASPSRKILSMISEKVRRELDSASCLGEELEEIIISKNQFPTGDRNVLLIAYWALMFDYHHYPLEPPLLPDAFRYFGARPVVAVEREGNVFVKLRPILRVLSSQVVEHLDRRARRILVRPHHERRYGANEHGHGDTLTAMPADVTSDLSPAGRVADVNRILKSSISVRAARSSA
jgi:hypothetical protein